MPYNEFHTHQVFEKNVGKTFVVKDVNQYGLLELELPNLDSIWIEPECVAVISSRKK